MSRLRVAPIVEGHGEVECLRLLLQRIWGELLHGDYIEVLKPNRQARGLLLTDRGLQEAVDHALDKFANPPHSEDPGLVLILIDAEEDCPAELGPRLLGVAREVDTRADVSCVVIRRMYETWFVAAAESLGEFLDLPSGWVAPLDPEEEGLGKSWVKKYHRHGYHPRVDQPRMTSRMDLNLCRSRSPSFDKLCREWPRRMG